MPDSAKAYQTELVRGEAAWTFLYTLKVLGNGRSPPKKAHPLNLLRRVEKVGRKKVKNGRVCGRWGGDQLFVILEGKKWLGEGRREKVLLNELGQVTIFQFHSLSAVKALASFKSYFRPPRPLSNLPSGEEEDVDLIRGGVNGRREDAARALSISISNPATEADTSRGFSFSKISAMNEWAYKRKSRPVR